VNQHKMEVFTLHVAMSNSITIWWHVTPSARSCALGASHKTTNIECTANKFKDAILTYDWFSVVVDFKSTKPISDEE
jgi:hypothetical protein